MNFDALIFLWPLLSFAAVVVAIPFAAKIARRAGLVDHPGGRKQHDGAIPLIGGLVIIPVFFSVGVFSGLMSASEYGALMMGAALLLLTGLYDDRYQINPKLKFAVQIIAAIIIMQFGGARIVTLGDLFGLGEIELYYMEEIFTVFCIVLLVNAVNLMDGLDGLAGGKCAIMFGGLLVACVGMRGRLHWGLFWRGLLFIWRKMAAFLARPQLLRLYRRRGLLGFALWTRLRNLFAAF